MSFADASTLSTSDWARFSVDADLPCTISWLNDCEYPVSRSSTAVYGAITTAS